MTSLAFRHLALGALLFVALATGCKDPGDRCASNLECPEGQGCYRFPTGRQSCIARCDATSEVLCASGAVCAPIPLEDASADVCLPGGTVAVGVACGSSTDCVIGAICVAKSGSVEARCRRACVVGTLAGCAEGETCIAIDTAQSATRGTCEPPP